MPDLEAVEKAINKNTKAIIFNSPNNPTGKVYPEETIRDLIKLSGKHNLALISDEVYDRFTYIEGKPFHSLMEYYEEFPNQNLIVTNSASKTYGMIGDRLGYIVSN
jgi:aspartate aminotransferase